MKDQNNPGKAAVAGLRRHTGIICPYCKKYVNVNLEPHPNTLMAEDDEEGETA